MNSTISQIRRLSDDLLFSALSKFGLEREKIKPSNRGYYEKILNQFLRQNQFKLLDDLNSESKKESTSLNRNLNILLVTVFLIFAVISALLLFKPNLVNLIIPANAKEVVKRPNFAAKSMGTYIFQTKVLSVEDFPKILEEMAFEKFTKNSETLINVFFKM